MAQNKTWQIRASSELTASAASDAYTNRDCRGALITIKNTDAGGGTSPTLTVKFQAYAATAGWVDISGAATTALDMTSAATTQLYLHPDLTAAANSIIKLPLPKLWRLYYTIGGSDTPTAVFSADADLLI